MGPRDWFAERSARGLLTRAVVGWLVIGIPVIAARILWSPTAAITVFLVTMTIYVVATALYMHRHHRQP